MSRTLFWYIFKDLLKVFLMASGALAGIMSFGGLLRPLTQQGLDAGQVTKLLTYFTFPMMAYSLPVAALFAATVVYGRLSADNEITACRAGGISYLGIAMPAFVLGIVVAAVSLAMLCFVVPIYTLKVERVVYSNLAKIIAGKIERSHSIRFGEVNVFAQRAHLPPPDANYPGQRVVLEDVSVASYNKQEKQGQGDLAHLTPKEFLMASSATIYISERDDDQVELLVALEGGVKFPRKFESGVHVGIEATQFGPIEIPSPIKEQTKFMDVLRLKELYKNPQASRRIKGMVSTLVRRDQSIEYLKGVKQNLNSFNRQAVFTSDDRRTRVTLTVRQGTLVDYGAEGVHVIGGAPGAIIFERAGSEPTRQEAKELRLQVRPDSERGVAHVTIELIGRAPFGGGKAVSGTYSDIITVPMPEPLAAMRRRQDLEFYLDHMPPKDAAGYAQLRQPFPTSMNRGEWERLSRETRVLTNGIVSETHGRLSFALSCFILVLVGCSLGMMFRSGNFLSGFAVSFIPALVCITLIVAGKQAADSVPWKFDPANSALRTGLILIWAGNAANLVLAVVLLWRLQRR